MLQYHNAHPRTNYMKAGLAVKWVKWFFNSNNLCACMLVSSILTAVHVPVVQLNYTAVSQDSPFNRDVVDGCVRETLLLLQRALASKRHTFLAFQGIGVLYFKNNKVMSSALGGPIF